MLAGPIIFQAPCKFISSTPFSARVFWLSTKVFPLAPSPSLIVADIGLETYTFDTVLPIGFLSSMNSILICSTGWTVQAAVYAIGDITDSTVLSSGQSDDFDIVSGGPSPQISVTVINLSTLSTIGGTVFTAFTPAGDGATVVVTFATATDDPFITSNGNIRSTTPTSTVPSIANNRSTSGTISPSTTPHNGLSAGTTIGIAVGVILVVMFLVLMASLYFLTKRRKSAGKKIDDQAIQLSGRLASHETFEKDFDTPTLKYGDDDAENEILSGRTNTAFESHNLRGSVIK